MVTKPAKEYTDSMGRRKVKGNMDIELAVDAMELAPHVDHIVLFSGDGDFRPLVESLQRQGVRVSVVSTIRSQPPMISPTICAVRPITLSNSKRVERRDRGRPPYAERTDGRRAAMDSAVATSQGSARCIDRANPHRNVATFGAQPPFTDARCRHAGICALGSDPACSRPLTQRASWRTQLTRLRLCAL